MQPDPDISVRRFISRKKTRSALLYMKGDEADSLCSVDDQGGTKKSNNYNTLKSIAYSKSVKLVTELQL